LKKAFTMIELILTMVILSIVAYIATGLIAKTYIGYNQVNTLHKANIKVEIALNSIAKRLSYAIGGTIVKRKSATDDSIEPIDRAPDDYEVLEWIGYDVDSFEGHDKNGTMPSQKLGWSGFCNIIKSNKKKIVTPGSDLNFTDVTISNLSGGAIIDLNKTAIFFPNNYNYRNIGYSKTTGGTSGVAIVDNFNNSDLENPFFILKSDIYHVTEHYKLAWSAYAVVPTNCGTNGCDLVLRYNYRPWDGEQYNGNVRSGILATNVTVFKTFATQNRVHIKICVKENLNIGKTTSICKEKVVFK